MHTLGHAGMQMHAHDSPAAQTAASLSGSMHDLGAMIAPATFATGGICDGGCAHAPGPSPHGGMTGWSVCLAVLGALAMVFLLTVLGARSRRRGPPAPDTGSWAVMTRGPPVRPIGLTVAAVSVLRV
jgi:hypothetical protein